MFAILPRQIDPYSLSRVEVDKVNSSYHLAIRCQVGRDSVISVDGTK